jgi:hypothetical protein
MNSIRAMQLALRDAARRNPDADAEQLAESAADILEDWARDAAHDRELCGEPEDSPCIESCDVWGTGEGRYHGVIA